MQRGYKRKRRKSSRLAPKLIAIALGVLMLALVWVWKSNQVKEYYSGVKRLETQRKDLMAENMRIRANLLDLKSISEISKVMADYGLTQNVSQRIFLSDPVAPEKKPSKLEFVDDMNNVSDLLDNAISGSGRVRAEQENQKGNF
jgi:hypothetical protein